MAAAERGWCREEGCKLPHLVVAPLSALPNWEREFARWAPHLNVITFQGSQKSRMVIKEHEFFTPGSSITDLQASRLSCLSFHTRILVHGVVLGCSEIMQAKGNGALQARVKFHVLLISYETALAEDGALQKLSYESLVVDEGHRLKNKNSRLFGALKRLRSRHRVLLTGTPLQNNLTELFMLLHFLHSAKFGGLEEEFSDLDTKEQASLGYSSPA